MCIYGMEGPGGYQLFGRTIQIWNTWRRTAAFADQPWLLRFFDQIRFFPVSHEELTEARAAFPHGGYDVKIEETTFRWADHKARQLAEADSITAFKTRQQTAFEAERARWKALGLDSFVSEDGGPEPVASDIAAGHVGVESTIPGNLWKYTAAIGEHVAAGDTVAIVESMKMEIRVLAPAAGVLRECRATPGKTLRAGQVIAILETD
jgi:urea carboxylase